MTTRYRRCSFDIEVRTPDIEDDPISGTRYRVSCFDIGSLNFDIGLARIQMNYNNGSC